MTGEPDFNDVAQSMGAAEMGRRIAEAVQKLPVGGKPFKQHRDYGKVLTGMWTGERVPAFARLSTPAKLVTLYLLSSPHANMLGLYRLPVAYLVADTGLTTTEAEEALKELEAVELVSYNKDQQFVWVRCFIATQVLGDASGLKPEDNQSIHARRIFDSLAGAPFRDELLDVYGIALNLRSLH